MGLDKHLINTVQGDEISANYRSGLALDNIVTAFAHPLGVGFRFIGARANRFSSMQTYNT